MRFTIEERHLTDPEGRPVAPEAPTAVAFHTCEAETVDDALRLYVKKSAAEVIGTTLRFPGFQAVATVRKPSGVYSLQLMPASR